MTTNNHNQLKIQHERATGDRFIKYYNKEKDCNFTFKEQPHPPKPDLIYYDKRKKKTITVSVEVTDAYYNENDAKGTSYIARGKASCVCIGILCNPDEQIAQSINKRIRDKCGKKYDYSYPLILVVVTRPALTEDEQDFQSNVLPHIKLPDYSPFSDIYLDVSFLSYHHYYHLYPMTPHRTKGVKYERK